MSPTSFSTVRTGTRKAVAPNAFPCNRVYESVSSCNIDCQKSSLFKRKMLFDTNDVILLRFEEQKEQIKRKEHIP